MSSWVSVLYLAHAVLELILGAIKLRGRYQHETPGARLPRSEMYTRHHGFSILSLSLLGYLVWLHDLTDSPTGRAASAVLALFHGGAVVSFLYAWSQGGIPLSKVIVPHSPFALGFSFHALRL
jgi:hypothetical protein